MLPSLRSRTIRRRHHQNRPIHLGRPRNHVLDVIGMTRHIDMGIVPQRRLILDMGNLNRDPPLPLLRSLINLIKRRKRITRHPLRQHLRNRRRQRRLPMINMTHRPHIHMRLRPRKLRLTHGSHPLHLTSDFRPPTSVFRLPSPTCSGGQTRTADLSIMSRALSPTELRRLEAWPASPTTRFEAGSLRFDFAPQTSNLKPHRAQLGAPSPLAESNRRPPPYHGGALPAELRGRVGLVPGEGFEPPKALPADLQSAPFGRSGIPAKP